MYSRIMLDVIYHTAYEICSLTLSMFYFPHIFFTNFPIYSFLGLTDKSSIDFLQFKMKKPTGHLLKKLRALMKNKSYVPEVVNAYIIPSGDAHQVVLT